MHTYVIADRHLNTNIHMFTYIYEYWPIGCHGLNGAPANYRKRTVKEVNALKYVYIFA